MTLTNKTLIKETNKTLKENKKSFKVISIVDFNGSKSRVSVKCGVHGNSAEWKNPWIPEISRLRKAKSCLKCSGKYKPTKEELIEDLNDNIFSDGSHTVLDIPDYENRYSRCKIECKKHGLGDSWGNPWNPTSKDLKSGYGCPKCYNNYSPTKEEITNQINNIFQDTSLTLIDIPDYKNRDSRCNINCNIHGNGWEWENKWTPIAKTVKKDVGCPLCAFETNKISSLLRNPIHFDKERYLYFIKFTKKENKEFFYKVGINNSHNINIRHPKWKLDKANLELEVIEHIKLSNVEALFTEFYILNKYKDKKQYQRVLKESKLDGATECFSENILGSLTLNELAKETSSKYVDILSTIKVTENDKENFIKYIKNL